MQNTQTKFFSKIVSPISNLEDAKQKGNYTWIYDWIAPEHVPLNQSKLPAKEIFLVPLNETIESDGIEAYLAKQGMKPCENAPEYLLGLMAVTPESELPEDLKRKDFVAANTASVFTGKGGLRCFLFVRRLGGRRLLSLVSLDGFWRGGRDWVFLAESLDSSTESLSPSDTLTLSIGSRSESMENIQKAIELLKWAGYKITREF